MKFKVYILSSNITLKAFESGSGYTSDIIKSIDYAEKMGASIVNCSFGSDDKNRALQDVIAAFVYYLYVQLLIPQRI